MYSVVIIDDNKIAVKAIIKSVNWKKLDCCVVGTAFDGVAGLKLIQELSPTIVIIDIQMPGFNGLDVIKKLQHDHHKQRFIIISGYSQFEYAQKAIHYGVSDYLLKPIMTDEMEYAILKAVNALRGSPVMSNPEDMDELERRLYEIRQKNESYSRLVKKAVEYVDLNVEKNNMLKEICEELVISTGHFSKCFKREIGIGFVSYVTMVKMEQAKKLLKDPKKRINEVATMLGYQDYAYFFQVFKKQFGYAPSEVKGTTKQEMEE